MSSIAGPGIGSGPVLETAAVRAVGSADTGAAQQPATQGSVGTPTVPVAIGSVLDAGAAPIDQDRVATIRKAIADNNYPLVPTKIGDAMIAAGMLLRMAK